MYMCNYICIAMNELCVCEKNEIDDDGYENLMDTPLLFVSFIVFVH